MSRVKDLIIDSYLSAINCIQTGKRGQIFELLGFDFLIDEDFRVWLIEVNTNPYLGVPNEYIEGLLPVMVDDLLAITVDPYAPPKNNRKRSTNDFELLFRKKPHFSARAQFTSKLYPVPSLSQSAMGNYKDNEEKSTRESSNKNTAKGLVLQLRELLENINALEPPDFVEISRKIVQQLAN